LGRVLACLCFLPNRFLSFWATVNVRLSPAHHFQAARLITLQQLTELFPVFQLRCLL
jgi:hypothetical protein